MKKLTQFICASVILLLSSCGGSDGDLTDYGLNAKVNTDGVSIKNVTLSTNVPQKVLVGKTIKITKGDVKVSISETNTPLDLEKEKRSVEMWDDRSIVHEESDALIIENKKEPFKGFEVKYTFEGQGAIFAASVESGDGFRAAETLEKAKEGLAIAKSITFNK